MSRRRIASLLVLVALMLVGCSSARPSCKPGTGAEIQKLLAGKTFEVKPLEFDDYGVECNRAQLAEILNTIRRNNDEAPQSGAITIVYVHGWHHGATTPNLGYFINELLTPLAEQEERRNPGHARKILGVYVSWRGQRWKGFIDNWPTSYYDRSDTAVRISTTGALEALSAMMTASNRNRWSRSVFIGHSMGGLIVERAFTTAMRAYISREADRQKTFAWDPPADLIVTINPAAPALEAWRFNRTLEEWKVHIPDRPTEFTQGNPRPWRPLIASLVSEGDWATSSVMSLASGLRYLGTDTGAAGPDRPLTPAEEKQLLRYASGFNCGLLTHVLLEESNAQQGQTPVLPCSADHQQNASPGSLGWKVRFGSTCATPPVHQAGDPRACMEIAPDRFRLLEIRKSPDDRRSHDDRNLYWIVRVPDNVMADHTDFFNDRSLNLIRGLLSLTGALAANKDEPRNPGATLAQESARVAMYGVQESITASAGPPGLCDVPDDVTFTFASAGCSGVIGDAQLVDCPPSSELTFRVSETVAAQNCANVEWQIGDATYTGPAARHTISGDTTVVLRLTSDRSPIEKKAFIRVRDSARHELADEPRLIARYRGDTSGCAPAGRPCITGERVVFEESVTPDRGPVLLAWDFGGGSVYGSKVEYQFAEARSHTVTAIAQWADRTIADTIEVPVVGCTAPPPPIAISYRGATTGCTESSGNCLPGETIAFRVTAEETPCGNVTWSDAATGTQLTRVLERPAITVSAKLTTAGGTSTAAMTVIAPPDPTTRTVTTTETVRTVVRCTFAQGLSKSYIVEPGDWLSTIAMRYYESLDWSRIYDASRRSLRRRHPDRIYPGDRLTIPLCDRTESH